MAEREIKVKVECGETTCYPCEQVMGTRTGGLCRVYGEPLELAESLRRCRQCIEGEVRA